MNKLFRFSILFVFSLLVGDATAQSKLGIVFPNMESNWDVSSKINDTSLNPPFLLVAPTITANNPTSVSIMSAPAIYDYHTLGVFCKFDVQLDKGSKIPLRFRLGTVDGMDEIERKGPTRYNY